MGANVIIGEIDAAKGTKAQKLINEGWGNGYYSQLILNKQCW